MEFFFHKKQILVLKMKMLGSMILAVRYFFYHVASNSWHVLIAYLAKNYFALNE